MTIDYTNNKASQGRVVRESGADVGSMDAGLRAYMLKVYNNMAIGLAITGIIAFITANTPALVNAIVGTPLYWVILLAEIGFVVYFSMKVHTMSESKARNVFWIYAALNGLTFSVFLLAFTGASVTRVFFITASMFGAMSLWGYSTKKDLTGMGSFLMMGLIGLIIASVVNIFMQSSMMSFVISAIGVVIFVGLTAYDTQKIKQMYYAASADSLGTLAIRGALTLYLDFINLMIMLLQLMGDRR